jgi:hypothetical protein
VLFREYVVVGEDPPWPEIGRDGKSEISLTALEIQVCVWHQTSLMSLSLQLVGCLFGCRVHAGSRWLEVVGQLSWLESRGTNGLFVGCRLLSSSKNAVREADKKRIDLRP